MGDWELEDIKDLLRRNHSLAERNPHLAGLKRQNVLAERLNQVEARLMDKRLIRGRTEAITFIIYGTPVGFRSMGRLPRKNKTGVWTEDSQMKSHIKGCKRTIDYYRKVREAAMAAGITLPLVATNSRRLMISVMVWYPVKKRQVETLDDIPTTGLPDPRNVQKGIEDALFYVKGQRNSDFACTGPVDYGFDHDNPRVEVTITDAGPAPWKGIK